MDEILTSEQVAQILQIHPFTVLKFIKQGKLKASKLGRVYRIRRSDVERLLDQTGQQSEEEPKKQPKKVAVKTVNEEALTELVPSVPKEDIREEKKSDHFPSDTTPHYTLKI